MQVQLNSDVAGHQLLLDMMGVADKHTQSNDCYSIITRMSDVFEDNIKSTSNYQYDESFVCFACMEKFVITITGYNERHLITVDVRIGANVDCQSVQDWLVHEFRPEQYVVHNVDRGDSTASASSRTRKIK